MPLPLIQTIDYITVQDPNHILCHCLWSKQLLCHCPWTELHTTLQPMIQTIHCVEYATGPDRGKTWGHFPQSVLPAPFSSSALYMECPSASPPTGTLSGLLQIQPEDISFPENNRPSTSPLVLLSSSAVRLVLFIICAGQIPTKNSKLRWQSIFTFKYTQFWITTYSKSVLFIICAG